MLIISNIDNHNLMKKFEKSKIINIDNLAKITKQLKKKKKKIVLCHGVFDLLHIGHIKHFQEAKKNGDILIVTLTADEYVNKGLNRPYFNNFLRAESLAAINVIDYVAINNEPTAINIIKKIKPDIYFKGDEYKMEDQDITGMIKKEKYEIKKIGGQMKYSEELTFSSSTILNKYGSNFTSNQKSLIEKLKKKFNFLQIKKTVDNFHNLKILIVGETIIDEYVFCEALGKSGKEPVLVFKDFGREKYLGGVLAIARHLSSFCKNLSVLSMIGSNHEEKNFINKNIEKNIKMTFIQKKNSPTIIKKRYIDRVDNRKVFGIYSLNDTLISTQEEGKILEELKKIKNKYDVIIVADYGHGMISQKIANFISNSKTFLTLNAQINSTNVGLHSIDKYKKINSLVINAGELRHEMNQREGDIVDLAKKYKKIKNCKYLSVTQGKQGAFIIDEKSKVFSCPAFLTEAKDKIGAGDAFLSLISLCHYKKIDSNLSIYLASLAAAKSADTIGNKAPIKKNEILKIISHSLK